MGRLNSKKLQHLTQINNAHMLVKVFNNLWRTSTAKATILSLVFSRRNILDFLSYNRSMIYGYGYVYITRTRKPGYLNLSINSHANSRFSTLINSHANSRFSNLMQTLASQLSLTLILFWPELNACREGGARKLLLI